MQFLSTLVIGALLAGITVFAAPAGASDYLPATSAQFAERGGCRVWGGRRLRSTNAGVMFVQFTLGLGRISADGEKGRISLAEKVLTANSYTPDVLALSFFPKGPTELIRDPARPQRVIADPGEKGGYTSQSIRQVKGPDGLVDIVVLNEWEYEIRFYHPDQVRSKRNGFYRAVGEPFSVSLIRNPNPPKTDSIEITTTKAGRAEKNEWKYDEQSDTWVYFLDGVETTRKLSEINATDPCERIETRFDLEGGRWLKTIKTFRGFPWGQEIVQKIEDADGQARVTKYKYFDDPNGPHYTFLKTTIHPDGTIERHNRTPDPFDKRP
jgi:hypothetical protein